MRVLHVPYGFFPDAAGGTEQYVASLAKEQQTLGLSPAIAAPAAAESTYQYAGLPVHRYPLAGQISLDDLYGPGDPTAAAAFARLLDRERPALVHLHAYTSGVSLRVAREASDRGIPIVMTYHSPSVSCARGTLMRWGRTPCSGVLAVEPCAPCTMASHGVPQPIALVATPVARAASRFLATSRKEIATAVRLPELVELRNRCALEFLGMAGRILTPAQWTRELLIGNGLSSDRVQLVRHGLPLTESDSARPERSRSGPLRVAYFGRLDPAKGPHLLIEAIERDASLEVEVVIFGIAQEQAYEPYVKALRRRTAHNPRVEVRPAIARSVMIPTMREFNVIAVPSLVLETGPLVVLEAFAAGVPVIGSKLGGIAELVSDGVNGLLLEPEPAAWAAALRQLAQQRDLLKQLSIGIQAPRTMRQVADEVIAAYRMLTP